MRIAQPTAARRAPTEATDVLLSRLLEHEALLSAPGPALSAATHRPACPGRAPAHHLDTRRESHRHPHGRVLDTVHPARRLHPVRCHHNQTYAGTDNTQRLTRDAATFTNAVVGVTGQSVTGAATGFVREPSGTLVSMRTGGNSQYYLTDAQNTFNRFGRHHRQAHRHLPEDLPKSSTGVRSPRLPKRVTRKRIDRCEAKDCNRGDVHCWCCCNLSEFVRQWWAQADNSAHPGGRCRTLRGHPNGSYDPGTLELTPRQDQRVTASGLGGGDQEGLSWQPPRGLASQHSWVPMVPSPPPETESTAAGPEYLPGRSPPTMWVCSDYARLGAGRCAGEVSCRVLRGGFRGSR